MRKTKEQIEQINQTIDILEKIITALVVLRDQDVSEAQTLKDLDIDQRTFRRICYTTDWVDRSHNKDDEYLKLRESIKNAIPTRKWTEDLFCAVVGLPVTAVSCGKIPPDVDETMINAIDSLTSREQTVIRGYYQDRKTEREIAEELGLSTSRIQQIESHAMRKLRHPSRLAYIVYGNGYYINKKQEAEKITKTYAIQQAAKELERLNELIEIKSATLTNTKHVICNNAHFLDLSIENLDLTVRGYNCLKRAGIETVGELVTITEKDLMKIRNMGRKAADDIIAKLRDYGLALQEGEETNPDEKFFKFIRH